MCEKVEELYSRISVLDRGFVELVDYMGGDDSIVNSARISYQKGTKQKRRDEMLINYLVENHHTSPLEQVVMTFHIKAPLFVIRQWFRHRTFRVNEVSGRYSELEEEFYIPSGKDIRQQDTINRQGAGEAVIPEIACGVVEDIRKAYKTSYKIYKRMLDEGIAREMARVVLPLGMYSRFICQMDLSNMMKFIKLRISNHAQPEIREYAKILLLIARKIAPIAVNAFEEYQLNSLTINPKEQKILEDMINNPNPENGKVSINRNGFFFVDEFEK